MSTRSPSQDSSAGSTVSEPVTAMPTTTMAPIAMPVNSAYPVRNSPASAVMTVSPDTTIARPDVRAALAIAWGVQLLPSLLVGFEHVPVPGLHVPAS